MPEPLTHAEQMRKKAQDSTKSISETVQDILESIRQQGELPPTT